MITKENFVDVVKDIDLKTLHEEMDKPHDFVYVTVSIFNAGSISNIESMDYDDATYIAAEEEGMLFCDKESFIQLLNENNLKILD